MAIDNKRVSVEFSVKSDEFNRNLTQTKQSIKQTTAELQTASAKLNTYGSNIQNLTGKQKLLETQIVNVNGKMKLYQENIEKNNQKLKVNQDTLQKLGDKKKDLANQYKEAVKLYGEESEQALKLKSALDQCKSEYDETNNKIKSNNKAINSNTVEMTKSEAELVKLQGELKNTKQAIQENSNGFLKASEDFKKAGDRLQKAGGYISDAGGNLMKISAPMVAFSAYATKVTMDFEEGMAKVQAISGATAEDMVLLSEKAKEMGKTTKFSATESAEALSYMAMAGWKTQDMLNGLPGIMDLAAASGEDLALTSDIVTDAMTAFGMSTERSSEFADVLASASNNANTNVAMLGESFKYVAPLAGSLGYNVQDTSIALGLMANSGIKASQAGTSLKTALVNMAKPTDAMAEVMDRYGLSLQNTDGSMKSLREVINMLRENMRGLDEATLASASATLFGKESLAGMLAIINASESDYNKLTNAIDNSSGASKKMADIMNKTAKGQITLLKSNLESLGIQIGEKLLPHINALVDKLSDLIDWFGSLDEDTQNAIVKFGLMTFATGGLLKGVGSLTKGIGGLTKGIGTTLGWLGKLTTTTSTVASATTGLASATGVATGGISALGGGLSVLSGIALPAIAVIGVLGAGVYAVHEANDMLNTSVLESSENMSAMELIMAGLAGETVHTKSELEQMGYVYEDWNSNVSPETQQALDNIAEKSRNLQLAIDSVNFDGVISEEDVTSVKTKTDEWCNAIVEVIDGNKTEINESVKGLFGSDGIVTEEEQKVLDILNKSNSEKKQIVQDANNEINAIIAKAGEENREVTEKELADITALRDKANKSAIESMNLSNEEMQSAQDLFFEKANAHSAEALSQSLVQEKTARDEQIAIIREKYDAGIQALQASIPTLQGAEKELAESQLNANIEQRDKLIQNENDKWLGIIGASEEKYPQYMDNINRYTGEEMSIWDRMKNRRFEKELEKYEGLNQITETGIYRIYNTESQAMEDVLVKTDETTGKVIALSQLSMSERGIHAGKVIGYSKDICNQMDLEVKNQIGNRSLMIGVVNGYTSVMVDSSGQIIDASGQVVGALENMRTATDGTREGFIDINGTPIKVQINSEGTIKNLKDIKTAVDNIPPSKDIYVTLWEKRRAVNASDGIDRFQAEGGTVNQGGLVTVNERGTELIDSISSKAVSLGQNLMGESINAPSNTKVTNALMTTLKMEAMVKREVSSGINNEISKMFETINSNLINSQKNNSDGTVSNETISKITNSNQSILKALYDISNLLTESNNKEDKLVVESTLVAEGRTLAKVITPYLPKEQMKYEKNNLK